MPADDTSGTVAAFAAAPSDGGLRTRRAAEAIAALAQSARRSGGRRVADGRWGVEVLEQVAPHLPVRDAETLSAHHRGLTGRALAEELVRNAARATAAVGATAGAVMSAEWVAPPALLSAPVVLAAETLLQVVVEVKLVAELHEALGRAPDLPRRRRMLAYALAWSRRRRVDPRAVLRGGGMPTALSGAARRELRSRLLRRFARGSVGVAPIAGAVAGGALAYRETRRLGREVIEDLER